MGKISGRLAFRTWGPATSQI